MNLNIPLDEIKLQVLNFMRELDCCPSDENLRLDGTLHRYHIKGDKPNTRNGAYCIYTDSFPAGFIQNWKGEKSTWRFNAGNSTLTQEQRDYFNSKEYKKQLEEKQKQRDKELKERYTKASENARIHFEGYIDSQELQHPYLTKKNIKPYGARFYLKENKIAVPLYNINGNFQSLQWISEDGSKQFYPGAQTSGAFFPLGMASIEINDKHPILICEGYATGAKIYQLTGLPTFCAMTSNNIASVAKAIKAKFKDRRVIIMADDDRETEAARGFNPGITAGQNAVNADLAVAFLAPPFTDPSQGTDWDDYALAVGDKQAREDMTEAIKWNCLTDTEKQEHKEKLDMSVLVHNLDPNIQLPPQEFIGGLFPRGFLSAVIAPPGTGKTIFMQKVVSDLSIGGIFFDGFAEDEPPRKCLIFAGEAGYELLIRRGASFKWPINPENVKIVDQYTFETANKSTMLDDKNGWNNIKMIIDMINPDIVFFDTFMSFHTQDENKAKEMKPMIKNLSTLAREKHISIVLNHHSRKRTSKERTLLLNQDDVIGSSIFNRIVALIIGIERITDNDEILQVRPLKSWGKAFKTFTFRIAEDLYGHSVIETNLDPDDKGGATRVAVWNYLLDTFPRGQWFSIGEIELGCIDKEVSERLLRKIIAEFFKSGKLQKRGENKGTEYSIS